MKKFWELSQAEQNKAKDIAMGTLIDQMLEGVLEIEWPNSMVSEVFSGAQTIYARGHKEAAKAYLMQSKTFVKATKELVEAAADEAVYLEENDHTINLSQNQT